MSGKYILIQSLTRAMSILDYLSQDGHGKGGSSLGIKNFMLSQAYTDTLDIRQIAQLYLLELAKKLKNPVKQFTWC